MQATPLFLGACALVSIAGVVSGTTINTSPIQRGGIGMNEIARPPIDFDAKLSDDPLLPDHYALNTPDGSIDVAELSTRGLYAQRRFGWREAIWTPPPAPAFDEPAPLPEPIDYAAEDAGQAAARVADTAQNVAQPSADEDAAPEGGARLIDVEQELADG